MENKLKARKEPRKSLAVKLRARKSVKGKKPVFRRQEGYRHVKLKESWRRPKGRHSKLRKSERARGTTPRSGYGSPREVRGLNRLGYRETRVSSMRDMERLDPREEMAVISGSVGRKKRLELLRLAEERKVRVSNA
jgi:large subunit ribosomal protein L32e